jgi:hypothetical protein
MGIPLLVEIIDPHFVQNMRALARENKRPEETAHLLRIVAEDEHASSTVTYPIYNCLWRDSDRLVSPGIGVEANYIRVNRGLCWLRMKMWLR